MNKPRKSYTKTFNKGSEFHNIESFVMQHVHKEMSGGPRMQDEYYAVKHKYIVTITRVL